MLHALYSVNPEDFKGRVDANGEPLGGRWT